MSTVTPGAPTASGQEAAGWTAYLAGVPLGLELPEDRPHATERTYHEGRCPLAPSPSLLGGIAALAHKERTAPAMVWLAALQALLHRYTSETDVLVGSPAAGAEPAETAAPAVVAWRTRLDGDLSFRMLLGRVEAVRRTLEQLGPLSVEACGELLHGEAVPTDLPLFQVGFVPAEVAGPAVLTGWVARTDLTLLLAGEDRPAAVELAFNRDRFEPATVERLARHLRTLMGSAVADPDRRLSELPLLSEAERHQILVEWNATSAEFPRDRLFHQIVEEQAARTPEATAVVDQGERLTYQQLNARTNQLAHHLRALGAGEGTRVVVGLERSAANIVAVLAILKAGAGAAGHARGPAGAVPGQRPPAGGLRRPRPGSADRPAHGQPPAGRGHPGQRVARHLHVRLDRGAQGGHDAPPRHDRPRLLGSPGLRPLARGPRCLGVLAWLWGQPARVAPLPGRRRHRVRGEPRRQRIARAHARLAGGQLGHVRRAGGLARRARLGARVAGDDGAAVHADRG